MGDIDAAGGDNFESGYVARACVDKLDSDTNLYVNLFLPKFRQGEGGGPSRDEMLTSGVKLYEHNEKLKARLIDVLGEEKIEKAGISKRLDNNMKRIKGVHSYLCREDVIVNNGVCV